MNANMGINEYLTTHATWLNPGAGIEFKLRTPPLVCADGFTMSVQASTLHYSKPASDHGPYTHVEVGNPSATVPELAFYRNGGVYAFVPVGVVDAIIAQHGGIALVLDMEPHEDKRTQPEQVGAELRRYMARARQAEARVQELEKRRTELARGWARTENDFDEMTDRSNDLRRQLNDAVKRAEQVERLLEDLTPGGSEFHGSPERCAEFVRNRLAGVIEQVKLRQAAEAKLETAITRAGQFEARLDDAQMDIARLCGLLRGVRYVNTVGDIQRLVRACEAVEARWGIEPQAVQP